MSSIHSSIPSPRGSFYGVPSFKEIMLNNKNNNNNNRNYNDNSSSIQSMDDNSFTKKRVTFNLDMSSNNSNSSGGGSSSTNNNSSNENSFSYKSSCENLSINWACKVCTFLNHPKMLKCQICETPYKHHDDKTLYEVSYSYSAINNEIFQGFRSKLIKGKESSISDCSGKTINGRFVILRYGETKMEEHIFIIPLRKVDEFVVFNIHANISSFCNSNIKMLPTYIEFYVETTKSTNYDIKKFFFHFKPETLNEVFTNFPQAKIYLTFDRDLDENIVSKVGIMKDLYDLANSCHIGKANDKNKSNSSSNNSSADMTVVNNSGDNTAIYRVLSNDSVVPRGPLKIVTKSDDKTSNGCVVCEHPVGIVAKRTSNANESVDSFAFMVFFLCLMIFKYMIVIFLNIILRMLLRTNPILLLIIIVGAF